MNDRISIESHLKDKFGDAVLQTQSTQDAIPTLWVQKDDVNDILRHLKDGVDQPYKMLYDLTAIDERNRTNRDDQPESDFSVVYHLTSFDRNEDIRIKVPLTGKYPDIETSSGIWECANWYEREVWDMFGVTFNRHPNLRRILMPVTWEGHPLRKEHPARATEMEPYSLPDDVQDREQDALEFKPEEWGLRRESEDTEFMFLNLGPQHPGTHGVLRVVLQLDGEQIVDAIPDIGFHHRGAEKMG
ncbi:MAG: NADH-quinone oxidoreductase subunit C/D, partial [Candidatus Marinimicrobia bacterium]|nr:NADH-quinone oxidoreductase subunit C/D [Candidatus Neomarinimicrobiota bacterium]